MCLKVLSDIFRRNFQWIIFFAIMVTLAGCSSNTQRFSNTFFDGKKAVRTDMQAMTSSYPQMLLYDGTIQSTELPPAEQNSYSGLYKNAQEHFPRQSRGAAFDEPIMGAPPRNLGVISRSQMGDNSILQKNSYIVQNGDTLLSIAQQIKVSVDALKIANGIKDDFIYIGQVLTIPNKRTVIASNTQNNNFRNQAGASIQVSATSSVQHKKVPQLSKIPVPIAPSTKIANSYVEKNSVTQVSNHQTGLLDTIAAGNDNVLPPRVTGISKMRWPVRGRLLSRFGQKKGMDTNRGIDISAPEGSSVKAAENGVVIYASNGLKELGNVVMIRHEDDTFTIYGHNSRLIVSKGQKVRRGDEIAKSGVSGNVKTPRVYFEVRKNITPVDPTEYLEN
ncbi:peptidoglycan DD-metalloendopeptidase family protein [Bartonella sp. B30(2025)]